MDPCRCDELVATAVLSCCWTRRLQDLADAATSMSRWEWSYAPVCRQMREEAGGEERRARGSKPPCLRRHRICIACPSMDIESRSNARHQQEAAHWERESCSYSNEGEDNLRRVGSTPPSSLPGHGWICCAQTPSPVTARFATGESDAKSQSIAPTPSHSTKAATSALPEEPESANCYVQLIGGAETVELGDEETRGRWNSTMERRQGDTGW